MPRYEIYDLANNLLGIIIADHDFVMEHHPGRAYLIEDPPAPPPSLDEAKAAKQAEVNAAFSHAAEQLTAGYPEGERLTWELQREEAMAWHADAAAPTPFLDGLAAERGIERDDMLARTLAQAQLFMVGSSFLVGTRQRLTDAINSAQTLAEVQAIQWEGQDADQQ